MPTGLSEVRFVRPCVKGDLNIQLWIPVATSVPTELPYLCLCSTGRLQLRATAAPAGDAAQHIDLP